MDRELPATDIADHFTEVTRSAISQHLTVLKTSGLVTERRDGRVACTAQIGTR